MPFKDWGLKNYPLAGLLKSSVAGWKPTLCNSYWVSRSSSFHAFASCGPVGNDTYLIELETFPCILCARYSHLYALQHGHNWVLHHLQRSWNLFIWFRLCNISLMVLVHEEWPMRKVVFENIHAHSSKENRVIWSKVPWSLYYQHNMMACNRNILSDKSFVLWIHSLQILRMFMAHAAYLPTEEVNNDWYISMNIKHILRYRVVPTTFSFTTDSPLLICSRHARTFGNITCCALSQFI